VSAPLVLLVAGGTGGHLFPAEALAGALMRRGALVDLATDERALQYGDRFPARSVHTIPSDTLRSRSAGDMARFGWRTARGLLASARLIRRLRPAAVVGFGGYPTVPPLIAAGLLGYPTLIHEQNVVMGRANRLLARRASLVATGFAELRGAPKLRRPFVRVGNPVRPAVLAQAGAAYRPPTLDGPLRLLVFGGSQGARVMSDVVPPAIARLGQSLRDRLDIVQQARGGEDLSRVREAYAAAGVAAEIAPFIADLPVRMAAAHLVVCRSGASTVAELAVIGRPAVLVPYAASLDQDQLANAQVLGKAGGAVVVTEDRFDPEALARFLAERFADAPSLARMATAAARLGIADAADRLADLVLDLAAGRDAAATGRAETRSFTPDGPAMLAAISGKIDS
jgi:UDP-N-acetylglucosamine--N-acetylmuramyl-(pentapeptide) pyrophosphoryl-undecaprenol N-acetylglucosamine transferase